MESQELKEKIKNAMYKNLSEEAKEPQEYHTTLTKENLDELEKFIQGHDIDPENLESSYWDNNPYGLEYPLSRGSGRYVYDDDEYYDAQIMYALNVMNSDYAYEYLDFCKTEDEDENWEEQQNEVIRVLEAKLLNKKIIPADESPKE